MKFYFLISGFWPRCADFLVKNPNFGGPYITNALRMGLSNLLVANSDTSIGRILHSLLWLISLTIRTHTSGYFEVCLFSMEVPMKNTTLFEEKTLVDLKILIFYETAHKPEVANAANNNRRSQTSNTSFSISTHWRCIQVQINQTSIF